MSPCSRRTHAPSLTSMAGNRITTRLATDGPLWFPLEEIGDQLEAEALALLRMELGADHGVAADDGGEGPAVIGFGDDVRRLGRPEVERVHEIGVRALRPERDAVEQRMRAALIERIPAHVRNLQARVGGRDAIDLARDPAEPRRHLVLAPALGHQLHADADAE